MSEYLSIIGGHGQDTVVGYVSSYLTDRVLLSFIAPNSGPLQAVSIGWNSRTGSPTCNFEVFPYLNGVPTGTAIASSLNVGVGAYSGASYNFTVTGNVTAGNSYCLVLTTTSAGLAYEPIIGMTDCCVLSSYPVIGKVTSNSGVDWQQGFTGALCNVKINNTWYGRNWVRPNATQYTSNVLYTTAASAIRLGFIYKPEDNVILSSVEVILYKTGSPTGMLIGEVWNYSSNTLVAVGQSKISAGGLATSAGGASPRGVDFNNIQLSSGTKYRIVFTWSGLGGDASTNYVVLKGTNTAGNTVDEANLKDTYIGGCYSNAPGTPVWTDYLTVGANVFPSITLKGFKNPTVYLPMTLRI